MIKNSKRFIIKGKPTFNNVRRDQINNNTTFNVETLHCNGEIATKRTEYDEFEYVKRGHVITLKETCSTDVFEDRKNGKYHFRDRKTQRKMYSIELFGQQSKFTAVEYQGEEADEVWEEDFQQFSRDRDPNSWLLYGLNHSKVPMLIFHHDLIPLAHLYTGSLWTNVYFERLLKQLGCDSDQIWMDTSKGVFCVGPKGLSLNHAIWDLPADNTITVPSTRDMLDTDTIFSFFQQFNSKELHQALITVASLICKLHGCDSFLRPTLSPEGSEEEQLNLQSFFPSLPYEQLCSSLVGLRFDTVYSTSLDAVARWPQAGMKCWWWWPGYGLDNQTSVDELTRFTMRGDDIYVSAHFDIFSRRECWLSQFPHCMEEGKTEDYFLIEPDITLVLEFPREYDGLACFFKLCDGEIPPPIYLFLYPPTLTTVSELISWSEGRTHFWSLDENGQSEMTEDEREQWGLPRLVPNYFEIRLVSWDSSTYTTLYDWQVAHGFDPTTDGFARYLDLDLPELEILRPKKEESSSWWEAAPGISAFGF